MGGSESTATLEDSHVFKGVEKFNEYFAKASSQEQIKQLLEKVKKDIANNLNLTDSEKIGNLIIWSIFNIALNIQHEFEQSSTQIKIRMLIQFYEYSKLFNKNNKEFDKF